MDSESWAGAMTESEFLHSDFYEQICKTIRVGNNDKGIVEDGKTYVIVRCLTVADFATKWDWTAQRVLCRTFQCYVDFSSNYKGFTAKFYLSLATLRQRLTELGW